MKKENSTNSLNNKVIVECPVSYTIEMIGGRWKAIILYQLRNKPLRFGQIRKMLREPGRHAWRTSIRLIDEL